MYALAYNLIRLVMLHAARKQQIPLDRISFVDAQRWLRDVDENQILTPLVINPERANRLEPRVLKRRMKQFKLMRQPRADLRKGLEDKEDAA